MTNKWLLLLTLPLLLSGCNNPAPSSSTPEPGSSEPGTSDSESSEEVTSEETTTSEESTEDTSVTPLREEYKMSFQGSLIKDLSGQYMEINHTFTPSNLKFNYSGTAYNKELALVSFAFHVAMEDKNKATDIYEAYGFSDLYQSSDYDEEENKYTTKYTIGHRKFDGVDLIALAISGRDYKKQWETNFVIGEDGDHAGFDFAAQKVLTNLKTYLAKYNGNVSNRKIWVTGYSRSAAISNIVSYKLLDEELVSEDNFYGYFFETPKGVATENVKEHKSIHNIINSGDIVTHVAPECYGLHRVGEDIDLYSSNIDSILSAYRPDFVLSKFTPDKVEEQTSEEVTSEEEKPQPLYVDEPSFCAYLMKELTHEFEPSDPDNPVYDLSTREHFHTYYEEYITYLLSIVFSLKPATMDDIKTKFGQLSDMDMLMLFMEDGLYNFLKPILDEHEETYDDEKLRNSLNALVALIPNLSDLLAHVIVNKDVVISNVLRCVQLHAPETVFVLLLAAN